MSAFLTLDSEVRERTEETFSVALRLELNDFIHIERVRIDDHLLRMVNA